MSVVAGGPRRLHPLRSVAYGLAMGAADAVPGISGGTIALLLGCYGLLLRSLASLIRAPRRLREPSGRAEAGAALAFLVPLGVGVLAAYWLATRLLVGGTESPGLLRQAATAPYLYGFFFGLVVASAARVWTRVPHPGWIGVSWGLLGAAFSFLFVGLPHLQGEPPTWTLLPGGAAAISVMLLPGVSGSLLLVILGQYTMVAGAVHDRELLTIGIFLVGVIVGIVAFVPLLRRVLDRWPRPTLATLTGLMLGSVRALWPWKTQYDPKAGILANHGDLLGAGGLALVGVLAAAGLGVLAVLALESVERAVAKRGELRSEPSAP